MELHKAITMPAPPSAPTVRTVENAASWEARLAQLAPLEERYRRLHTQLYPLGSQEAPRSLCLTSAVHGEGKSTAAWGLAATMARDLEATVLLVEADLRGPGSAPGQPGLSDAIGGEVPLDACLRPGPLPNLTVLAAGSPSPHPSRLLRSASFRRLLLEARGQFDFTLLDATPVAFASDASVLAALTDGTVLVVQADVTPREVVLKAIREIPSAKLQGVVVNGVRTYLPRWLEALL